MSERHASIELIEAQSDGAGELRLITDRGPIECRHHNAAYGDAAVLWVFGAGGGLGGPAGGVYSRLGERFTAHGISSLELAYRRPAQLVECVLDVLLGIAWLESQGRKRICLVGHSFGGAVVLNAAGSADAVIAVAALSSQTAGVGNIASLAPRPLLFVHGEDDEILPAECSRTLFARARQPKELVLYPACRHGLDDCRDELDADLARWIGAQLAPDGAR